MEMYTAIMETIYVMSVPGLKESIEAARIIPLDQYSDTLDWSDNE